MSGSDLFLGDKVAYGEALVKVLEKTSDAQRISIETFDIEMLVELWCVLRADEPTPGRLRSLLEEFEPVYQASEAGPWIDRLPEEFIRDLSIVAAPQLEGTAEAWHESGEMFHYDHETVAGLLSAIIELARRCRLYGKSIYLWTDKVDL